MRRIHIIGRKNSGKTTLIVDLVRHFSQQGRKVATVKHTHHNHELDTPGKDSFRHRQAGAVAVGVLSTGMDAIFWPARNGDDMSDRYHRLSGAFAGCDLVLVEGDSQAAALKIEVWRAVANEQPLALQDSSIAAIVTDDDMESTTPVWSRADVPLIAERLWGFRS